MPIEDQTTNDHQVSDEQRVSGKFAPGHKKLGGRQKGAKNRFTELKEDYLAALEHLGKTCQAVEDNEGLSPGAAWLVEFAKKTPKAFAMGLVKLLPATNKDEVTVQGSLPPLAEDLPPQEALEEARRGVRIAKINLRMAEIMVEGETARASGKPGIN